MKVLLRRNISKLGHIGEVVEVKSGYARNYLLPQGLAVTPTELNVRAIEAEKQHYLEQLAHEKAELQARAALVANKEVTITARANKEGVLYGSVGPAQIVAALGEQNLLIETENVVLAEPIRKLDKYEVKLRFSEEVSVSINVWVVPVHGEEAEDADVEAPIEAPAETAADDSENFDDFVEPDELSEKTTEE